MSKIKKWVAIGSLLLGAAPALANVTGSELQNFNAAYSFIDGVSVHSARTQGRGRLSLGLFGNLAVNTLPYFDQESGENIDQEKSYNDSVTGTDLAMSYGVLDAWDFSLGLASFVGQSVENNSELHGYFARLGFTEIRVASKFNLISSSQFALGVLGTLNHNLMQNNPYSGNVAWPASSLELLGTFNIGDLSWHNNLGYRSHRGKPDPKIAKILPIERFGDQWVASSGLSMKLASTQLELLGEVYGSYSKQNFSSFSPRNSSVIEGLLGFKYPLGDAWQLHGGAGSELRHAISSADYRFYAGVRWLDAMPPSPAKVARVEKEAVAPATYLVVDRPLSARHPDAIIEIDDITFRFDSTELRSPEGIAAMAQLQAKMQGTQKIERVLIEGHTCTLGSDSYNFELSDRRAETIERWLVQSFGVAPEKLITVGWGEKQPKISNEAESGRMQNRRVRFKIYYELPYGLPQPQTSPSSNLEAH